MPTFPETTKRLVRRWNRQARLYDRLTAPMERLLGLVRGRAWVFERVAKGRVLEIGAGTGKNLPYYPERVRVVASDLSPGMLARAVEKARDGSRAVRFVVTDAEDLARIIHECGPLRRTLPLTLSLSPSGGEGSEKSPSPSRGRGSG